MPYPDPDSTPRPPEPILSAAIEARLVHDLFDQWDVLLIGGLAPASVAALAYSRTRQPFFIAWGVAALLVLAFRAGVNFAYARGGDGATNLAGWRRRFLVGTWANGGLAGAAAVYALFFGDGLIQMLVITQLVSFVMGSAARNSLYPRAAAGSILLAEVPLFLACLAKGGRFYGVYAAFVVLFSMAALSIMRHLYSQTVRSLATNEENAELVAKFNEANRELAAANGRLECDIRARVSMERAMEFAARHDRLTGLANRMLILERIEEAAARVAAGRQRLFGVMFLDFDRFKMVNDTLGHAAGDELLKQIADRLRHEMRAAGGEDGTENVVSRFGGDEFVLLLNDLGTPEDSIQVAERLLFALEPAYTVRGTEVHSTASIGVVTSDRCMGPAEDFVRNADVAMFEAKRAGRACFVVFDDSMHRRLKRHVSIENSLRHAIGTAEMRVVYQPIVNLETGATVSVEALARWTHPTLGDIGPSEFIPIAEESGLIVALGRWTQREACAALAAWRRSDPRLALATISVNLSRAELALGMRLIDQLRAILHEFELPARCLQLEVTEREVMRDPSGARAVFAELQKLGVKLAMDDFGTGTSSLSLLRDFPFDTIKIDRSFLHDLSTRADVLAVIHATIDLVENLGMTSVAEGVEEQSQIAILQSMGCRCAQGYYFGRPVPAPRLLESIAANRQASSSAAMRA